MIPNQIPKTSKSKTLPRTEPGGPNSQAADSGISNNHTVSFTSENAITEFDENTETLQTLSNYLTYTTLT